MILQGDIWWAEFGVPIGSQPGYRRPVVIVQADSYNRSPIATVVVVPLTSNLRLGRAPGNVVLAAETTGLPLDSVANVTQLAMVNKSELTDHLTTLPRPDLERIFTGIDVLFGRR